MKKTFSTNGFKLAILGAALAISGAAVAGKGGPDVRSHDRAGHHACHHLSHQGGHHHGNHAGKRMGHGHHAHWRHAGMVIPGYGSVSQDFVDGMGLNDEQLKLIEDARQAAKDFREKRKEQFKDLRQNRAERFSGTIDPQQALKQADEKHEKARVERREIQEKWIGVWNSLDAQQQERITAHLKQRAEKAQKRAERLKERKQQREEARESRGAERSST